MRKADDKMCIRDRVNPRLHIRVASYDVWKRFKKQDLSEYELEDLSEIEADSYVIDESSFDDIEDIVLSLIHI